MERKYNFCWWRNITINMEKYIFRWWRGNITLEMDKIHFRKLFARISKFADKCSNFWQLFPWKIPLLTNLWFAETTSEVVWQKKSNQVTSRFFGTHHHQFLNILVLIGSLYSHWIGLRCEMKNEQWQVSGRELPTALCLNSVRHTLPGTEISCVKFYNLILWFIIKSSYNFYILLPKVK